MSTIKGFADTIAWYDANAKQYAKNIQNHANIDLMELFTKALAKGALVLDVGCAAGRDTKLLKEKGLVPKGIDISPSMIDIARSKNESIDFYVGNFLRLPFKNHTFDGIWAHACLLHLETVTEVEQAIVEFHRTLKPGGVLHVFVKKQQGKKKTLVVKDALSGNERFFQFFKTDEIKKIITTHGFEIITMQDDYPDNSGRTEVTWIHVLARRK